MGLVRCLLAAFSPVGIKSDHNNGPANKFVGMF